MSSFVHRILFFVSCLPMMVPTVVAEEVREVIVNKPPASIAAWYKPTNDRQVWLHTMFSLRREMQAISDYTAYEDSERLQVWAERFAKHYTSIGKMVPEWADELEVELVDKLLSAAKKGDFNTVARYQRQIGRSCIGCHKEFRAVTAALYRGTNFSNITVEDSETMEEMKFKDVMSSLSTSMNRVLIALADSRYDEATSAYKLMRHRLADTSESCSNCHKTNRQRDYLLNEETMAKLESLGKFIEAKDVKQSQQSMGAIAVNVCASCHSIHRTLSDLRGFIGE